MSKLLLRLLALSLVLLHVRAQDLSADFPESTVEALDHQWPNTTFSFIFSPDSVNVTLQQRSVIFNFTGYSSIRAAGGLAIAFQMFKDDVTLDCLTKFHRTSFDDDAEEWVEIVNSQYECIFPRGTSPGLWMPNVIITDHAGYTANLAGWVDRTPVKVNNTAGTDSQAPTCQEPQLSVSSLDLSVDNPFADVSVTFGCSDSLSGLKSMECRFFRVGGGSSEDPDMPHHCSALYPATTCMMYFSIADMAGDWSLSCSASDNLNNVLSFDGPTLTLTNSWDGSSKGDDNEGPFLESFTLSQSMINIRQAADGSTPPNMTVFYMAELSDDTMVESMELHITGPGDASFTLNTNNFTVTEDMMFLGIAPLTYPTDSEEGTYVVSSATFYDVFGNSRSYPNDDEEDSDSSSSSSSGASEDDSSSSSSGNNNDDEESSSGDDVVVIADESSSATELPVDPAQSSTAVAAVEETSSSGVFQMESGEWLSSGEEEENDMLENLSSSTGLTTTEEESEHGAASRVASPLVGAVLSLLLTAAMLVRHC